MTKQEALNHMELWEAMEQRHSVRAYLDRPVPPEVREELSAFIAQCNQESGLHMQPVWDGPKAFAGRMAKYGKFSGVKNYIAVAGPKGAGLDELYGYYGEKVVLRAQQLGLNTCWVAMTYSKGKAALDVQPGQALRLVIAIGYGQTQGVGHKVKRPEEVARADGPIPEWFQRGVHAALLAPTAMNQQKFRFTLRGSAVSAEAGLGFYSKIDLGIARYHFEVGAGADSFTWSA